MDGNLFAYGTIIVSSMTSLFFIATISILVLLHFRGQTRGKTSLWTRVGIYCFGYLRNEVVMFCSHIWYLLQARGHTSRFGQPLRFALQFSFFVYL